MDNAQANWRVVAALLVTDPGAPAHFQALQATARLAKPYPVRLTGELEPLNLLMALETAGPAAYDKARALFDRARAAAGKRVPQEVLDTLRAQFWAWVDDQLDAAEAAAKKPK